MSTDNKYHKIDKRCHPEVKDWDEYDYLFDLIVLEKRNPYLQGHHPQEKMYPLIKKIAESNISDEIIRTSLVMLLEQEA